MDFKKLGDNVQAYQNSVVSLNLAKEQEADALERLVTAQEEYENALKNGTEEQKMQQRKHWQMHRAMLIWHLQMYKCSQKMLKRHRKECLKQPLH